MSTIVKHRIVAKFSFWHFGKPLNYSLFFFFAYGEKYPSSGIMLANIPTIFVLFLMLFKRHSKFGQWLDSIKYSSSNNRFL